MKHKEGKNWSLPAYFSIYSKIALDFTAKGFWRKRLRLLIRQRLNTTRWVVRNVRRNYLYGMSFYSGKSDFILAKDRIYFQTKGTPFAIHLITVYHSHLKTVHITFGPLNASDQSYDIEKILFFRTFIDMIGCSHQYLFDSYWVFTTIECISIVFSQHVSCLFCVLKFLRAAKNHGFFKKSPLKA